MQEIRLTDIDSSYHNDIIAFRDEGANKKQMIEYALAIAFDCDTSLLKNVNLSAEQMREIRLGEMEGIDTSLYSSFDAHKMKEIRYGLECARIDRRNIKKYLNYSTEQIKAINDIYNEGLYEDYIAWCDDIKYSPNLMLAMANAIKTGCISDKNDMPFDPNKSDEENINALNEFCANVQNSNVEYSETSMAQEYIIDDAELFDDSNQDSDDDVEFVF